MQINNKTTDLIKYLFKKIGIGIARYQKLESLKHIRTDATLITSKYFDSLIQVLTYTKLSHSQLNQDLFVLLILGLKKNGFFVEFGATNGRDLSNSFLLESNFGWTGILAEPARCWHKQLFSNRNCFIETSCVWSESNITLNFSEASSAELSTVSDFSNSDFHKNNRRDSINYSVNTISLNDLLEKYNAPKIIDYLSIDTEGSEYKILEAFDFSKYNFRVITCEHNFTKSREKIYTLLSKHGYSRIFPGLSDCDDWFINASLI